MLRGERGVDRVFKVWQILFRACDQEDIIDNRFTAARISSGDISVNWSKYSAPWDLLFVHPDSGIARIFIRDLPTTLPSMLEKGAKIHKFLPQHTPLDDNYGHCEITAFKGPEEEKTRVLSTKVKKELRTILSDRFILILKPRK